MEPIIDTMVDFYKETYAIEFKKLSKAMQDRVLACKLDNIILDPDVDEWVTNVCNIAEAKQQTLLSANKQLHEKEIAAKS